MTFQLFFYRARGKWRFNLSTLPFTSARELRDRLSPYRDDNMARRRIAPLSSDSEGSAAGSESPPSATTNTRKRTASTAPTSARASKSNSKPASIEELVISDSDGEGDGSSGKKTKSDRDDGSGAVQRQPKRPQLATRTS